MSSVDVKEVKAFKPEPMAIAAGLILAAVFIWTYTFTGKESVNTLRYLWIQWFSPDYQHGFFVLPFCAFLLWSRREMMTEIPARGSWWGLAFFGLWAGMRLFGVYYNYAWFQHASIIPGVAAITLFVGGWQAFAWAWPSIVFMAFMIPLPGMATDFLSQPLQRIGSFCSAYLIQTFGIPAMRSGVVIQLRDMPLNVAEACSGIRMLMLFFALCVGGAFLMKKNPWWERLLIVASAIPIAVAANVVRLTLIALFSEMVSKWPSLLDLSLWHTLKLNEIALPNWPADVTKTWVHNLPGLLMMPVGMVLLLLEWTLLSRLFIEEPADRTASIRGTTRGLLPMAPAPRGSKRP
ncbi:MAG: exosortase/archaeosortase family protein [Pirellulales bacterium]|nr:exosortase/archaeosortase family protein [Pirellulales bacterium]